MAYAPTNAVPADDFSRNLRTLCTTHRSVSEVCRLTAINRQQFGRYLNGTYRPSRHNLRRICGVLGVSESELVLPAGEFEKLLNSNVLGSKLGGGAGWLGRSVENLVTMSDPNLNKYLGWYHSYSYSFGWPKWIIRSLVHVYEHQGRVLSKTIERVTNPIHDERFIYKLEGLVTMSADRIFIAEHDSLQQDGFSLKILFRTHRSHVDFLSGLVTGTSSRPDRQPTSARVVLEYLGRTIEPRTELAKCGMFEVGHHTINSNILSIIDNTFAEGDTVLHAIAR